MPFFHYFSYKKPFDNLLKIEFDRKWWAEGYSARTNYNAQRS